MTNQTGKVSSGKGGIRTLVNMMKTRTKAQFLRRFNALAAKRNLPELTSKILSNWVDDKAIPPAERYGQGKWHWTARQYRMALEIARLKKQGAGDIPVIRWHLWIKGYDVPGFDMKSEDRLALIKEFGRRIKPIKEGDYSVGLLSLPESPKDKWRANKRIAHMGALDPDLHKYVGNYARNELLGLHNFLLQAGNLRIIPSAISRLIELTVSVISEPDKTGSRLPLTNIKDQFIRTAGGLFRDAIDNSIRNASKEEFIHARRIYLLLTCADGNSLFQFLPRPFQMFSESRVRRSLATPDWRVIFFCFLLCAIRVLKPKALLNLPKMPMNFGQFLALFEMAVKKSFEK